LDINKNLEPFLFAFYNIFFATIKILAYIGTIEIHIKKKRFKQICSQRSLPNPNSFVTYRNCPNAHARGWRG
jgi:hypothetical protein